MLVYDLRGSGVVKNVCTIAQAAQAAGIVTEIWVIARSGAMASSVPEGVVVRELGSPAIRFGRTIGSALAVPRISATLREIAPRVLLSAGNQMHVFASAAWHHAGRPAAVRMIARASNAVVGRKRVGWRAVAHVVERFQYTPMQRIVAVAPELAADLAEHLDIDPRKVAVIPNGVALPAIGAEGPPPHPWLAQDEPPVILGIGRLARQKNFELLLEAFFMVRRSRAARLVILGEGPRRAKLERLAARLAIADSVLMPGFVQNPGDWLQHAKVFALSSRWEGNSNALLEALASGCAIVATDISSGARTVLDGGRFGHLVPPENPRELADAIVAALDCPPDAQLQRARAADYSIGATMDRYVSMLASEIAASSITR